MYLLEHYGDIKNINILDMAEECFVDRSTIRRFFVKYGFDSFKEFKEHYENSFEERYFKEIPFQTYGDFQQIHGNCIICRFCLTFINNRKQYIFCSKIF